MGSKIDSFKDEVMCDRAVVKADLAKTATKEDLLAKAEKRDLERLNNNIIRITTTIVVVIIGFVIWIIEETVKRSWK
jgi:hypothetical protein